MIASTTLEFAWMPPSTPARQSDAVPWGKQADVQDDVLQPVQEEDHPHQERARWS